MLVPFNLAGECKLKMKWKIDKSATEEKETNKKKHEFISSMKRNASQQIKALLF